MKKINSALTLYDVGGHNCCDCLCPHDCEDINNCQGCQREAWTAYAGGDIVKILRSMATRFEERQTSLFDFSAPQSVVA